MEQIVKTLEWKGNYLQIIDQSSLPIKEKYIKLDTIEKVYDAIKSLKIRGAPAIGLAASFGLLLAAKKASAMDKKRFMDEMAKAIRFIKSCRPTAFNLFYGIGRLQSIIENSQLDPQQITKEMEDECKKMFEEDLKSCTSIGEYGESILKDGMRVLTHCNAGGLATSGIGTALAPIYLAKRKGKEITVFVDETRPVLQGARLTMWELKKAGVKAVLICDNMAGFLMQQGKIDLVITGADRIAKNGDTANKIGTYSIAVLANYHKIPFYVAAPSSTFDFSISDGSGIPIECRDREEVKRIMGQVISPDDVDIYNPAFDITPHNLITAFITEKGVFSPDLLTNINF
ncbi:MAG: S-methyl-5-thioribose-1-phosphate isomerase [Candidatus Omnitrophica bacterium]|nr:S-methyl-5-thioribose-1-phosphate isomerase [Candidatus Omnitrophota bacterium]